MLHTAASLIALAAVVAEPPAPPAPAPAPVPIAPIATIAPTAPAPPESSGLLDVDTSDGLYNGRISRVVVKAKSRIVSLSGVYAGKRAITFDASGGANDGKTWEALIPIEIEQPAKPKPMPLILDAEFDDASKAHWQKPVAVSLAPYQESKLTVDKQFMAPSAAQRLRAQKESAILEKALSSPSPQRLWRGSFAKPVPGIETSPFGTRRTYMNDKNRKKSRHYGWDLNGATGDPIAAAGRGRIALAADRFYSGGTIVIDHGQGLFTMYFHMSRIDVKEGDIVEKGQLLGAVGASGQVTGPHLHFAVKCGNIYQDGKYLVGHDLSQDVLDAQRPPG